MNKIITIINLFIFTATSLRAPEIEITNGLLRGKFRKTWKGREFQSFTGIPYAKPPIGDLRFEPPAPADPWSGVLDATKYSDPCVQMNIFETNSTVFGNEDCLYLNVYSPWTQTDHNKANLLPVMVYIHGGAFRFGSGDDDFYGPDILLDKDIVFITLNYRLNFLGFSSTGDSVLPGNNGLKDQNLALQWVKKNVKFFSGNPDKITIFGQSAGGASVHLQLLSPKSKDLFHSAISHSGVATAFWAIDKNNQVKSNTYKMGQILNCPTESSQVMIECLRKYNAYELIAAEKNFEQWGFYPLMFFTPVIEPNLKDSFISEDPIDIIKLGKFLDIPFMTGFTTEEGATLSSILYDRNDLVLDMNKNFESLLPTILQYDESVVGSKFSKSIKRAYFKDGTIDTSASSKMELTDFFSDSFILVPENVAVQLHTKYTSRPVFYYVFGYKGTASHSNFFGDSEFDYGVSHSDDLLYLLSCKACNDLFKPYEHRHMIETMVTLWTNFATTDHPTPSLNSIITEKWQPSSSNSLQYYLIESAIGNKMSNNKYVAKNEVWSDFTEEL